MIYNHPKSPRTGVITESVYASSKLSDCIVYSFVDAPDCGTLYSINKLEMDTMVLCEHTSISDSSSREEHPLHCWFDNDTEPYLGLWINLEDFDQGIMDYKD